MTDQIREHITDIRQLAEEMALTAEGVPGMNLALSKARIASVCRAFLAATAPRPEVDAIGLERAAKVCDEHAAMLVYNQDERNVARSCASCIRALPSPQKATNNG